MATLSFATGIAALSITLQLTSGFEDTLGRAVQGASGHVVHPLTRWVTFEHLENFVKVAPPGIEHADFYWNSQGLIVGREAGRGVLIEGTRRSNHFPGVKNFKADIQDEEVRISLGTPLAKILGVEKGDRVRLLLPGVLKGSVLARIERLVSHGIFELDSRFAVVDDESLRNYLKKNDPSVLAQRPGDAHGIRFFLDPKKYTPKASEALATWIASYKGELRNQLKEESVDEIFSWRDGRSNLFSQIEHDKGELSVVIGLLSLVAALNIAATLVVLFLMRDRDIAILQALGLGPRGVFQWILLQGTLLGIFSSALGLLLGQVFGFILLKAPFAKIPEDIYNIGVLPLKFVPLEQFGVFAFGVGAAVLFAVVLATGLARLNLIQVLGSRR